MNDGRLFFKLHNGFPEHPKAVELSDKAFRQLVEAWCYCSRNLNDGKLTKSQFLKLFSLKTRKELLSVGFVVATENGYEMHDYLQHQQSAEQVENRRITRAEAGRKGGQAKAKGVASATAAAKQMPKQNGSKNVPDTDTDTDKEKADAFSRVPAPAYNAPRRLPTVLNRHAKIPDDLIAEAAATIGKRNIDLQVLAVGFVSHHAAAGTKSSDWPAKWLAWAAQKATWYDQDVAANGGPGLTKEQLRAQLEAPLKFKGKIVEEPA